MLERSPRSLASKTFEGAEGRSTRRCRFPRSTGSFRRCVSNPAWVRPHSNSRSCALPALPRRSVLRGTKSTSTLWIRRWSAKLNLFLGAHARPSNHSRIDRRRGSTRCVLRDGVPLDLLEGRPSALSHPVRIPVSDHLPIGRRRGPPRLDVRSDPGKYLAGSARECAYHRLIQHTGMRE